MPGCAGPSSCFALETRLHANFCGVCLQDASPVKTPGSARPPYDLHPEEVVALRSGAVLLKGTILKSDHFPGCQNMRLTPLIDGAPNFRQVGGALQATCRTTMCRDVV